MTKYELYHHGIKGQQWGVRNGPPYPLSRSEHNKVVSKKGNSKNLEKKRTGVNKGTKSTGVNKEDNTSPVSAVLAGLGIGFATEKKLVRAYGIDKAVSKRISKETARNYLEKPVVKNKSELSSLKTLSKEEADDIKIVNEAYGIAKRTTNNSAQCSLAYVMRQNGYNVVANNKSMDRMGSVEDGESLPLNSKALAEAVGKSESDYISIDEIPASITPHDDDYYEDDYFEYFDSPLMVNRMIDAASSKSKSNNKDGLYLLNAVKPDGTFHSAVASVENGKTYIVDAQLGEKTDINDYFESIKYPFLYPKEVLSLSGSNLENDNICQYLKRGD